MAALVEGSVAHGAKRQAVADHCFLAGKAKAAVPRAGGNDDAFGLIAGVFTDDHLGIGVLDAGDGVHIDVSAKLHGLLQHPLGKLVAGDLGKARIILQSR